MKKIDDMIIKFIKYLIDNEYIDINNSRSICKYICNADVNIRFKLSENESFYIREFSSIKSFWPQLTFDYVDSFANSVKYSVSYDVYDKLVDIIKTESKLESLKKELVDNYEQSREL